MRAGLIREAEDHSGAQTRLIFEWMPQQNRLCHPDGAQHTLVLIDVRRKPRRGRARKRLDGVQTHLDGNRHRMAYDAYLEAGFPIATGVIEGACRHLVKVRGVDAVWVAEDLAGAAQADKIAFDQSDRVGL